MFKYNERMYHILCKNRANVHVSDNCLSCYSLNLCCPINMRSNVMGVLDEMDAQSVNASEIDDTNSTQISSPTEYEMISIQKQEETV